MQFLLLMSRIAVVAVVGIVVVVASGSQPRCPAK